MSGLSKPYAVELLNITKTFGDEIANKDVSLKLRRGEIHALLGENGAGKSTLMNVLFGLIKPDSGEIYKDGKKVEIKSPNDANALGIGMVHQHFKLIGIYSALDNIILGDEPTRAGFLTKKEAREKIKRLSDRYQFDIDPNMIVDDCTVGMQQRIEILKMLYRDNDILIFDEPTAVLTPQEIDQFLEAMKTLSENGCSILFITHHLEEIMRVADRCTILSRGRVTGTVEIKDTTKEELSRLMVGRDVQLHAMKKEATPGETVLRAERICVFPTKGKALWDIDFAVREGEIVCIAGIDGNGQSELAGAITGMLPIKSGRLMLRDKEITKMPIRKRSRLGISHIPEDRLKHAMIAEYTVEDNMILWRYDEEEFSGKFGFLRRGNIRKFADKLIDEFDIRTLQGSSSVAGGLSGGNQQKMVVARELEKKPDLLVAVQPVRGLDVGAIEYIHNRLIAERDAGRAVLLISLELEEVLNVADRILVMFEGRIVAELDPKKTNAAELGMYMAGGGKAEAEHE